MNLAFYVHTTNGEEPLNKEIYEFLNSDIEGIRDKSLFFNAVGYNSINPNFGLFSSTEIWAFRGTLVVKDIYNLAYAQNVTNKIDIVYLHSEPVKPLELLVYAREIEVYSLGESLAKEYKRLTGKNPKQINSIQDLWEQLNER